jgi:hypothetical protein
MLDRPRDHSILDLFEEAAPDLADEHFRARVAEWLRAEPDLIDVWERYSEDQRATPNPYLSGSEVGFYDGTHRDFVGMPSELRRARTSSIVSPLGSWSGDRSAPIESRVGGAHCCSPPPQNRTCGANRIRLKQAPKGGSGG